ncbi:YkvA family protein [Sandaracinobacteroides sp. A072]|uniref:YkvA family protein n=1 Tax=Sandaracinobacteroides sp. A072 TaxID=3461146 RepID=UPI0040420C12
MSLSSWAKETSHRLRRDAHMLWIAARDPRTPLLAKLVGGLIATYVLSPIDLIPDFVPVLGLLDELILVPLGLALAVWLVPAPLMAEFRAQADRAVERPISRAGALLIIGLWVMIGTFIALQLWALRYW